jgi:hypothetical protein
LPGRQDRQRRHVQARRTDVVAANGGGR